MSDNSVRNALGEGSLVNEEVEMITPRLEEADDGEDSGSLEGGRGWLSGLFEHELPRVMIGECDHRSDGPVDETGVDGVTDEHDLRADAQNELLHRRHGVKILLAERQGSGAS